MIANEDSKELAMELLCAMTIEEIAEETNDDIEDVYREFRRSKTFEMLFDEETGLWLNGPDYVAYEYESSKKGV